MRVSVKTALLGLLGLLLIIVAALLQQRGSLERFEEETLVAWKDKRPISQRISVPKLHFVTFADQKFQKTLDRIKAEALSTHAFSQVHAYTENNLGDAFWNEHRAFVNSHSRGFGYWIWKPWVILKTLEAAADGDIIVYADAGCGISTSGIANLIRYCSILTAGSLPSSSPKVLGFQMDYQEDHWTKMDLFYELECATETIMNSGQVMATALLCQKTPQTTQFMQAWYDLCSRNNYHFLDDSLSYQPNAPGFQEHRHDQSIFSLLCKTLGAVVVGDEVQTNDPAFPIRALRSKF